MTKKEFIDQIEAYPDNAEITTFNGDFWETETVFCIRFDKFQSEIVINDRR